MKINKNTSLPLDKFIEFALYDKDTGYYIKKNPFGKEGDFITAPNITRLFSEMIAIWVVTFWKSIGSPQKFNLFELGAGNGEMMKVIVETLKNFPQCFENCKFYIHEKSKFLIKQQQINLSSTNIEWVDSVKKINSNPTIFLANEFFDALPIKQFFKKKEGWFERYVNFKEIKKAVFNEQIINIEEIENKLKFKISKDQDIIEYSPSSFDYLQNICEIINKNNGGMLIIDYGYLNSKIHETLQAVKNHKYSNILEDIGNSDITYNINFNLFKQFINQFDDLNSIISNQKKFLTSMGILQRAEIISENIPFSEKTDLFYRVRRLIDEKQMGNLFKVMLIKKTENKFNSVGGKSKDFYKSLNCSFGSKDKKLNVKKNLEIVRKKISNQAKNIFLLHQFHSNKFIYIDKKYKIKKRPKADAIITNQKYLPIAVLTADCAPVLIYDNNLKMIAAIHAGWKGTFKDIVKKVVKFMIKKGCSVENMTAVIGPSISQKNYEVREDFKKKFIKKDKNNLKYFKINKKKLYFDLTKYIYSSLKTSAVRYIEVLEIDTYDAKNKFFSARRALKLNHHDYGRNISIIMLN